MQTPLTNYKCNYIFKFKTLYFDYYCKQKDLASDTTKNKDQRANGKN